MTSDTPTAQIDNCECGAAGSGEGHTSWCNVDTDTPTARQEPTLQERLRGARRRARAMIEFLGLKGASVTTMNRLADTCDQAADALDAAQARIAELEAQASTAPDVTQAVKAALDVAGAASLCELRALLCEVEAVLIGPSDEYEGCADVLAKVRTALAEGRG